MYMQNFSRPATSKLFVGQIPKTMKEEQVAQIFSASFNIINAHIIKDRTTQEHKGI